MANELHYPFVPFRDTTMTRTRCALPICWLDYVGSFSLVFNTDGASRGNPSSFAARGLIRSSKGGFIAGFLVHLGSHSSNSLE